MSTTSKKRANFVKEPMRNKPVTALPGVGPVQGERLRAKGINNADAVLGQYLTLGKSDRQFEAWLAKTSGANTRQAAETSGSLRDWCNDFL